MLDTLIGKSTCRNICVEVDPERLRPIDADLQVPDTTKFATTPAGGRSSPSKKLCRTCSNIGVDACATSETFWLADRTLPFVRAVRSCFVFSRR